MARYIGERRTQLSGFFWQVQKKYNTFSISSLNSIERDRSFFQIGKPNKLSVRFYDYTENLSGVEDPTKAPHLQWTLKDGNWSRSVRTDDKPLAQIVTEFKSALERIFQDDYHAGKVDELRDGLMIAGDELIFRGSNEQLRFTFLEGDTVHGHAYIEPLSAPVQIL